MLGWWVFGFGFRGVRFYVSNSPNCIGLCMNSKNFPIFGNNTRIGYISEFHFRFTNKIYLSLNACLVRNQFIDMFVYTFQVLCCCIYIHIKKCCVPFLLKIFLQVFLRICSELFWMLHLFPVWGRYAFLFIYFKIFIVCFQSTSLQ